MYFQPIIFTIKNLDNSEKEIEKLLKNLNFQINSNINKRFIKAEDKSTIGIDRIIKLINDMSTKKDDLIAYIIEGDRLTEEAQNSLLKTLEEGYENSLVIIISTNIENLLSTVISRCILLSGDDTDETTTNELFSKFSTSNFIQRSKIIEEIVKNTNPREVAIELNLYIIKYISNDRTDLLDSLTNIHRSLKQGSNVKLALETLNIILEN